MVDYNLNGLNPRDFEHMVQALAKGVVGPGVTPFGDGPDGGREATFEGASQYPSTTAPWVGYLVVQCKFRVGGRSDPSTEGRWVVSQVKQELAKVPHRTKRPDSFLFVTNVRLTAAEGTGTRDKAMAALSTSCKRVGIQHFDIWAYDDLCRFIDANRSVRQAYGGFITPGDVLAEAMAKIGASEPAFLDVMTVFLQRQLESDLPAKLESAGQDPTQRIALATVFVDLPSSDDAPGHRPALADDTSDQTIVATLIENGSRVLRPSVFAARSSEYLPFHDARAADPRSLVIGGPGQGKSTVAQFLCQMYRSVVLLRYCGEHIEATARDTALAIKEASDNANLVVAPRFPLKVVLSRYAAELAGSPTLSLLQYLRDELSRLGHTDLLLETLKKWFELYPWVIVLDGLDEVPAASNREQMLDEIQAFCSELTLRDCDAQVIATTRPQSYRGELNRLEFSPHVLIPLGPDLALKYATKLAEARWPHDDDKRETVLRRLRAATSNPATAKLMQSPLQVTIMTTLVERIGEPPRERYRLFAEYYRSIYGRETGREGVLAATLGHRKTDIDTIHYRTGLYLQVESEVAGLTESQISDERFRGIVDGRLSEVGIDSPERDRLVSLICDSSLERLVFLVRPTAGMVGFEIRSLQEFMAAEALLRDGDELALRRIREIAKSSYWRNVLLFCIGSMFVEHENLLDNIISLCHDLNVSDDPLVRANALGSQLAIDILGDGSAQYNPHIERQLVGLALQATTLGDPEIGSRIGTLHTPGVDALFKEKILGEYLRSSDIPTTTSAWMTIAGLCDAGVPWALAEWRKATSADPHIIDLVFSRRRTGDLPAWARTSLEDRIPDLSPMALFRFVHFSSRVRRIPGRRSPVATWLEDAGAFINEPRFSRPVVLRSANRASGAVLFTQLLSDQHWSERAGFLERMPVRSSSWRWQRASYRLHKDPSANRLAAELRELAEFGPPPSEHGFGWLASTLQRIAWPLEACAHWANSAADLNHCADLAEAGELGSGDDWNAAEARWLEHGVTIDEIMTQGTDAPFGPELRERGFPTYASSLSVMNRNLYAELFEQLTATASKTASAWLRSELARNLIFSSGSWRATLTAQQVVDLYNWGAAAGGLPLGLLGVALPTELSDEWLQTVDVAGRLGTVDFPFGPQIRFTALSNMAKAAAANPRLTGVLRVLAFAQSWEGRKPRIKRSTLKALRSADADSAGPCAVLQLAAGDLDSDKITAVVADLGGVGGDWMTIASRVMGRHGTGSSKQSFARGVLLAASEQTCDEQATRFCYSVVREALEAGRTGLADPSTWDRLGLRPPLLSQAV